MLPVQLDMLLEQLDMLMEELAMVPVQLGMVQPLQLPLAALPMAGLKAFLVRLLLPLQLQVVSSLRPHMLLPLLLHMLRPLCLLMLLPLLLNIDCLYSIDISFLANKSHS